MNVAELTRVNSVILIKNYACKKIILRFSASDFRGVFEKKISIYTLIFG